MAGAIAPRLGYGRLKGLRVLIAEDSWLTADTLTVLLEEEGAHVLGPSATCAGAVDILAQERTDVALIDLHLADAFADALVDDLVRRKIPYAVLTGYGALPTNAGEQAIEVISKPIEKAKLIDLLSKVAKKKKPSA